MLLRGDKMLVNEIMHKILSCEEGLELHKAIDLMVQNERRIIIFFMKFI